MNISLLPKQGIDGIAAVQLTTIILPPSQCARLQMDKARLDAVPATPKIFVDAGDLSGTVTVTIVCHRGEIVQVNTLGWRNIPDAT